MLTQKMPTEVSTLVSLKPHHKDNKIIDSTLILNDLNELSKQFEAMPETDSDWKKYIVDTTKKISKPDPILIQSSTGIPLFHYRNLSSAAAAMKVGKTKENIAFVTAILHPEGFLNFHCPKADARVLFGDTEMDSSDTMEFVIGVNKCLGKPENTVLNNFIALNLREVLKPERAKYIEDAIIDFKPDFVIVDGIVDLCNDFNSIADSSATVEMLTTWASKYNCHVHTNIHVNKGANNSETRGHLGQILRQKGEVTLLLSKKIDTVNYVEVKPIDSRHRPIEDFYFRINNDGLPEEFFPLPKDTKTDILKSIIEKCFEVEKSLRYAELTLKIMEHGKVKIDAAKTKIQKAVKSNLIYKNEVSMYCLRYVEAEDLSIDFDSLV
jgi:hypothetical protein